MAMHANTQSGKNIVPPIKKKVLSSEIKLKRLQNLQKNMSGSTSSGRVVPPIGSFSGTVKKPVVKSSFETAAERQRQREADLETQKEEESKAADEQRARKNADDLKKAAEERARQAELQKQQDTETVEAYCARAERQGFLKSKWNVDTVQQCIDKVNARKRLWKQIMDRAMDNAAKKRKTLEDALKKRCLEAIWGNRPVPAACRRFSSAGSSSSWTTQSGGTLTTTR
jgi:membrane protein involved in colicin uptake